MTMFAKWVGVEGRFAFALDDDGQSVELSDKEWLALLDAQQLGARIIKDTNGRPVATYAPTPMTDAQRAEVERAWRDAVIDSTGWVVSRHRDEVELGEPTSLAAVKYDALMQYRKALRDWPSSPEFPNIESRPVQPAWLTKIVIGK
jgi:hypothetical protein